MSSSREQEIDRHVGRRIRDRRHILRITQKRLGQLIGVKFQQIQKYEKGDNRVSASKLVLMAEALQVPVGYFFEGIESGAPDNAATLYDWRDMRLAAMINGLAHEYKTAITGLVKALGNSP